VTSSLGRKAKPSEPPEICLHSEPPQALSQEPEQETRDVFPQQQTWCFEDDELLFLEEGRFLLQKLHFLQETTTTNFLLLDSQALLLKQDISPKDANFYRKSRKRSQNSAKLSSEAKQKDANVANESLWHMPKSFSPLPIALKSQRFKKKRPKRLIR